jgi:hypothetical protein
MWESKYTLSNCRWFHVSGTLYQLPAISCDKASQLYQLSVISCERASPLLYERAPALYQLSVITCKKASPLYCRWLHVIGPLCKPLTISCESKYTSPSVMISCGEQVQFTAVGDLMLRTSPLLTVGDFMWESKYTLKNLIHLSVGIFLREQNNLVNCRRFQYETARSSCQLSVISCERSRPSRHLSVISYERARPYCQLPVISYERARQSCQLLVISYESAWSSCQLSVISYERARQFCQLSVISSERARQFCQLSVISSERVRQSCQLSVIS